MKLNKILLILLNISLVFTSFSQSAIDGFLKGKNVLDIAVSGSYQFADEYIGGTGKLAIPRNLVIANVFAEYGVSNKFDVIATIPVLNGKLQDGALFGKYKVAEIAIRNQKLSLIPAIGVSAPLSKYETNTSTAIGQRATQFHGHFALQTSLPAGFYWQAQAAYHLALNPVPSSYTFSSKLMYTKNSWYFDAWYEYQKGLGTNTYPGTADFRTLTVDYQRIGGVVFKGLKNNFGVFVSGSYVLSGLDTFLATTISVGLTKKIPFTGKKEVVNE